MLRHRLALDSGTVLAYTKVGMVLAWLDQRPDLARFLQAEDIQNAARQVKSRCVKISNAPRVENGLERFYGYFSCIVGPFI